MPNDVPGVFGSPEASSYRMTRQKEITMTQSKPSSEKSRFGHWVRVVVMFLSFGMIFPNVMTEEEDFVKHDTDKSAHVIKQ